MTNSDVIEMELPYLRRYARAVLGDAAAGDRAVERMLEAVIAERPDRVTRVSLFRHVDLIMREPAPANGHANPASTSSKAPRRAFLLTAMESLSEADAAAILNVSAAELSALLASARQELASLKACKVVIIEDEPLIVGSLSQIVESLGHSVVGVAVTRAQAVSTVLETRPDLLLVDIQLADGSQGTDAVAEIRARYAVPAIFITAFPAKMLAGKSGEPTFLISKPFRPAHVKAVISQALFMHVRIG
ncbi:MAG: response regulator [Hyphomonas sp.]